MISRKEAKKQLVLQMGSTDNVTATEAVRQLRERGWLIDGTLRGAYLNHANLTGIDLNCADLKNADLSHTILTDTTLDFADMENINLIGAKLNEASLIGAKLVDSRMGWAELCGAKFGHANLTNAKMFKAKYDTTTRWSDNFDPINFGAEPIGCDEEKNKKPLIPPSQQFWSLIFQIIQIVQKGLKRLFH